ncbi:MULTISPECIES: hypothetical protein [Microbacterium]|uniref:hypothetical protein n=1 Tax=Microbacterium TaxID=33882 RepID=UPI001469FE9F|nr:MULTISPECIES: hypothetical protein [Microbacterium]
MNRTFRTRPPARRALLAAAVALGALSVALTTPAAYAGVAASAPAVTVATDASAQPVLHVGVRQAGAGDPIPVTIVGASAGEVWQVVLAAPQTTLGTLTIGQDGTGTTLVSLPVESDPGSVDIVARTDGEEISTALSSTGDREAAASVPVESAPDRTAPAPSALPVPVLIAGGAAAAVAVATTFVIVARRRRTSR